MLFGSEYGTHSRWSAIEGWYIRRLGVVDLPSRLRARMVLKELRKLPGNLFLDIGSGTGTYSFYLSRHHLNKVWAVDVDTRRVDDCNSIVNLLGRDNVRFCASSGDGGLEIFTTETFDVVLAIEVLQYVPDLSISLEEAHRVLKPGGFLVSHIPVLGYLRDGERNLFDDRNLPALLTAIGFQLMTLTPTFGKNVLSLCRIFEWGSRRQCIAAVTFPFLLLASRFFKISSADGNYRFFVARKPLK
jgi:SAM-dependent methyltransferase